MSDAFGSHRSTKLRQILIGSTGFGLMGYAVPMGLMGWYRKFNVA
jgi:hypothetical protein